jgi:hypothetical protein
MHLNDGTNLAIKFQLFRTLIRFDCGCDVSRMYCYNCIPQKKGVFWFLMIYF